MPESEEKYRELKGLLERMYGVKLPEEPPRPWTPEEKQVFREKLRQATEDPEFLCPQSGEEDM